MIRINNKNISRSISAIENKDFQTAIKYCNDELKKNKKNKEVYLLRGSAYNQLNKTELAIEDFKTALLLDPSDLDILKKLFFSYTKIKDIQNSVIICQLIITQYPSDNDELVFQEICRLLMEREQYKECLKLLSDISKRSGEHHIYTHLIGLNYFYLRDYENAVKFFKKAYKAEPNVKYLISLTEGYQRINQGNTAFDTLLHFWRENKHSSDLTKDDKLKIVNSLAETCLKNGEYEECINWYNEIILMYDKREEKISVEHKKAHIYKLLKQFEKALEIYQVIIRTNQNSIPEFIETAEIYKRLGKYREAYEEFEKVLYLDPYNMEANLGLAQLCLMKQDYKEAKKLMTVIESSNRKNVSYLKQCVDIYFQLLEKERNNDEMIDENKQKLFELLSELIILNSNEVSNYEKMIHLLLENKDYDKAKQISDSMISINNNRIFLIQAYVTSFININDAEKLYEKYLILQQDASNVFLFKAKNKFIQEDYQESLLLLEECLSYDDVNIEALELLIQVHIKLKEWEEAMDTIETLININEDNSEYYFKKAMILARLKRYDEAIPYFQKTFMLNNFHIDAYYNIANVYLKLKHFEESLKCYKIIIYLNPEYDKDVYIKIAQIYKHGG